MYGDTPSHPQRCAYPGCENEADPRYRCLVCKGHFCAFHIYQQGGYVCKTHFNAPSFAPRYPGEVRGNARLFDWLARLFDASRHWRGKR